MRRLRLYFSFSAPKAWLYSYESEDFVYETYARQDVNRHIYIYIGTF